MRLGLLLSEIGAANGVEVTEQEMNRLIVPGGRAVSGQGPRDASSSYVQQEPMAAAQLRAPLYEDKVVDFLFSKAEISERKATRAELEADLESEEGHVHGPGCGHDHAARSRPRRKKAAPKRKAKAAAAKAEPAKDEPAKGAVEKPSEKAAKPKPAKPVKDAAPAKAPEAKAAKAEAKPAAAKKPPAKKPAKKG